MTRVSVLIFAGLDPSGGAGIAADVLAVSAQGAHALPVLTTLTVQDNDRAFEVLPVDAGMVARQAQALIDKLGHGIGAVKIGIPGNRANAQVIADIIIRLRHMQPALPVVLDPVLASGHGDALSRGDAVLALAPLLPLLTLIVPNGPEMRVLSALPDGSEQDCAAQAAHLRARGCQNVLVTGGHAEGATVVNRWYGLDQERHWNWPRLPGGFHGSGCTLAAAITARLALGETMAQALSNGQAYCHQTLVNAYAIGAGQRIPQR